MDPCSTAGLEQAVNKSGNRNEDEDDIDVVSERFRTRTNERSIFAHLFRDDDYGPPLPNSITETRPEGGRSAFSKLDADGVRVWSTWIPPPMGARTPPPDNVYEDYVEANFSEKLQAAFHLNKLVLGWRCGKYGSEVANLWKKGSTPEEDRQKWSAQVARAKADLENVSDSD